MDIPHVQHPQEQMHPAVRTAGEALLVAAALTLITSITVHWVLRDFGFRSDLADTATEASRWFLPMFGYLWGMFWMIDTAHWRQPRHRH